MIGSATTPCCHVCGSGSLEPVPDFEKLVRVTSDCKPWPRGGRLVACGGCGTVQKPIDAVWCSDAEQIYKDYTIYYQSNGVEQAVYDPCTGRSLPRSSHLLECVRARLEVPPSGRLLDVGCGNGAFLRAFSRAFPSWSLAGVELDYKYREAVEGIAGVEALYVGPPAQVPGLFDFISLIHALEHIPDPRAYLAELGSKLVPDGLLLVQIPNFRHNPFDLLVADHASHFSPATVREVVQTAGFEVIAAATDWVPKEQTILARRATPFSSTGPITPSRDAFAVGQAVAWLRAVAQAARACTGAGRFGLFGTSIAATWLAGELDNRIDFFVDEDPSRVGKSFLGRPIQHPNQVAVAGHIFVGLPRPLAESICHRLERPEVTYHLPPALAGEEASTVCGGKLPTHRTDPASRHVPGSKGKTQGSDVSNAGVRAEPEKVRSRYTR
jgi:SAM-dependent methyltransferase